MKYSNLNGTYISHSLLPRCGDHCERYGGQIVGAIGAGCDSLNVNSPHRTHRERHYLKGLDVTLLVKYVTVDGR